MDRRRKVALVGLIIPICLTLTGPKSALAGGQALNLDRVSTVLPSRSPHPQELIGTPSGAEIQLAEGRLPDEVLRDLRVVWPQLSDDEIRQRNDTYSARKILLEKAASNPAFAGSWYTPTGTTWHVAATDSAAANQFEAEAFAAGIPVQSHQAKYSYAELDALRSRLETSVESITTEYSLSVDTLTNRVALLVPPEAIERIIALVRGNDMISVAASTAIPHGEPVACTGRYSCGNPLRGGIQIGIWTGSSTEYGCTLGFTMKATDGSRWASTAGHCITQTQVNAHTVYGHGSQAIGDARDTEKSGAVDFARVRVSGSYWTTGGYLYTYSDSPVDVNYAIFSASTIEKGDPVCIGGRSLYPTQDACGAVTAANQNGRPQIYGVRSCTGDSGGPNITYVSGERWAYGLTSVASPVSADPTPAEPGRSCTPDGQGYESFSSIPHINAYNDSVTAATLRVETR